MSANRFRGQAVSRASLVVVGALILVGCAPERPMIVPSPSSSSYTSTYKTPEPEVIAPLRGTTADAASLAHPSLAAKIDDHPDARPQVGLERTDIVFEELVEGGLTRYVAVWHSDIPEEIGPVRSIRPMDPDIISAFGGIVAYSGGQQRFVALMQKTPVFNAIHGQKATADTFYRTKSKAAPHNVIVRAGMLVGQHLDLAPPAQQFAYALNVSLAASPYSDSPGTQIDMSFSQATKPSWTYVAAQQYYLRAQKGVADMDSNGAQLHATNVIALRVGIDTSLGVPKTQLIGSGEATVFTGGVVVHGTWSKGSPTQPIRLVDANGVVIRLSPGNTWIELVPKAGSISVDGS